jgi:hypothetical protein
VTGVDRARRIAAVTAVAVVAFAAGAVAGIDADADDPASRAASGATEEATPTASPSTSAGRRLEIPPEMEPYDYRPAPPREPTPVDGFYMRIFTLEEMGGPELGVPFHCLRCVPYSVDAGVQTLLLHEGRFYLEHQLNEFRALGHYVVEGGRIAFFNDVNCSRTRGTYAWELHRRRLRFDVIDDPCPYVDERSNDLTLAPWTRIDVCYSGIKDWYPVRVGCLGTA